MLSPRHASISRLQSSSDIFHTCLLTRSLADPMSPCLVLGTQQRAGSKLPAHQHPRDRRELQGQSFNEKERGMNLGKCSKEVREL